MTRTRGTVRTFLVTIGLSTLVLAMPGQASDGVIEINQASAIVSADALGFPVRLEAGNDRLTGGVFVENIASNKLHRSVHRDGPGIVPGNKAPSNGEIGRLAGAAIFGHTVLSSTNDCNRGGGAC